MLKTDSSATDAVLSCAVPLHGTGDDYDALLRLVGDARIVLLGEATHGTHEFYRERARITQRLIAEKQFSAIAIEADWPDAYRVNRYVSGAGADADSRAALAGFERFPTWMWRNTVVVEFVEWLRRYNAARPPQSTRVGFYGLDLYSLFTSIDEVLNYLDRVDPHAAQRARARYACFDHFDRDSQRYGYETAFGLSKSCESEVVAQLRELRQRDFDQLRNGGAGDADEGFYAEQNARLIRNAEEYYRTMYLGRISSWNLRDSHMMETLGELAHYLARLHGKPEKIVVWEHNSHIGDARATEIGRQGEWNVGQLVREHSGDDAVLIGFTTYHGTVSAASEWGGPVQRKHVRPALAGSYEDLFHQCGLARFFLPLRGHDAAAEALGPRRLERAIGVIYQPETERRSHYFHASLPAQFDAVLHFDKTRAVEPLERGAHWEMGEAPETFPSGL